MFMALHVNQSPVKAGLTCTGRISLPQPSLRTAVPLLHSAVAGSLSYGTFVYGHRRCRVCGSFLCGRKKGEQLPSERVSQLFEEEMSFLDFQEMRYAEYDSSDSHTHNTIKQALDVFCQTLKS